jgi:hypothetical protein
VRISKQGAVLDGVSFTNPLDPEFDLAALS